MSESIRFEAGRDDDFEPGVVRRVRVSDRDIAVVRLGEDFYAIGDTCSHDDVSLSEGDVDPDECTIECSKHGSLFSLESGSALTLPALKPVPTYAVESIDGVVWVVIE